MPFLKFLHLLGMGMWIGGMVSAMVIVSRMRNSRSSPARPGATPMIPAIPHIASVRQATDLAVEVQDEPAHVEGLAPGDRFRSAPGGVFDEPAQHLEVPLVRLLPGAAGHRRSVNA